MSSQITPEFRATIESVALSVVNKVGLPPTAAQAVAAILGEEVERLEKKIERVEGAEPLEPTKRLLRSYFDSVNAALDLFLKGEVVIGSELGDLSPITRYAIGQPCLPKTRNTTGGKRK